jgi:ABC-2 type transport system permease protein
MEKGNVDVILEIPNHFERRLQPRTKQRYLSVSTPLMVQPRKWYITQIIASFNQNSESALSIQWQ